jgi:uncharacterized membrane protein
MTELTIKSTLLFFAILATALSAGLFYAWSVSVIPGLKNITDKSYIETMQSINRAILNPGFFIIFFGALVLMILTAYFHYKIKLDISFWFIIGAIVFYMIGTVGVTAFGNVPLNEKLELINILSLSNAEIENTRIVYETKWNQIHTIRMFYSVLSLVMLLLSVFVNSIEIK